jgi:uridine kinase
MTKVVAICGCMGSGKTTLVRQLHQLIPRSSILLEDHYQTMTHMDALQLDRWRARGAHIAELNLNGFDVAVRQTIDGTARSTSVSPPKILILESQFGRFHPLLSDLIDFQIWIDVPLDISLARRILQYTRTEMLGDSEATCLAELSGFCEMYLASTASLLREQNRLVEAVCDATLENNRSIAWMVDSALALLQSRALLTFDL